MEDEIKRQISTDFRNEHSYNGYRLDELKSGIQKYVRRAEIDKAIWCALELDLFAYDNNRGETIRTNLIHRLMIIFLEDVSLGGLEYWPEIDRCIYTLFELRKQRKNLETNDRKLTKIRLQEINLIIFLVTIMCKSDHARICSHFSRVYGGYQHDEEGIKIAEKIVDPSSKLFEIIDIKNVDNVDGILYYAHRDLKHKRNDAVFWFFRILDMIPKLSAPINRSTMTEHLLFDIIRQYDDTGYVDMAIRWFKELKNLGERFLPWMTLVLARTLKWEYEEPLVKRSYFTIESLDELPNLTQKLRLNSYVLDIHTRVGRKKGMDRSKFVVEGARVTNESRYVDTICREIYVTYALSNMDLPSYEQPPKESHVFDFIIRAQLTTSHSKSDTYFAVCRLTEKRVFVKGPFLTDDVDHIIMIEYLKKQLHLPYVRVEKMRLIPDLLESPLGTRTRISEKTQYYFLVFDDICKDYELPGKMVSSKVWPETEVVDWDKIRGCRYIDIYKDKWLVQGLFRYVAGITDSCRRNFLTCNGKVYSVDTEGYNRSKNSYKGEMKKMIDEFLMTKKAKKILEDWFDIIEGMKRYVWFAERIEKILKE
jgi:hypothetical protein